MPLGVKNGITKVYKNNELIDLYKNPGPSETTILWTQNDKMIAKNRID